MHSTDLHFQRKHFDWLWQQRNSVDVICLTGDFLDPSSFAPEPIPVQMEWIKNWISRFDTPLFICSGKHDVIGKDEYEASIESYSSDAYDEKEFIEYEKSFDTAWLKSFGNTSILTDGGYKEFNELTFGSIGYGEFNFSRFKHCDVILTHLPPANTRVSKEIGGENFGCEKILRALKNRSISPKYLLSGHIHKPILTLDKLKSTWLSNPGSSSSGETPSFRIIEL